MVVVVAEGSGKKGGKVPPVAQLLWNPLAMLALVPSSVVLFAAGTEAGTVPKTVTAPLDRLKLLMQIHSVRVAGESTKRGIGLLKVTYPLDALRLRLAFQSGHSTMITIAQAYAGCGDIELCGSAHAYAVKIGLDLEVSVTNSILGMYLSFASLEIGREIFRKIAISNVVTWTMMMGSLLEKAHA